MKQIHIYLTDQNQINTSTSVPLLAPGKKKMDTKNKNKKKDKKKKGFACTPCCPYYKGTRLF